VIPRPKNLALSARAAEAATEERAHRLRGGAMKLYHFCRERDLESFAARGPLPPRSSRADHLAGDNV
jgi:hypothetical protein